MTPELPAYWQPQPPAQRDAPMRAAFDALLDAAIAAGPERPIDYLLAAPKWQFLCYVAEERGLVLHGSPQPAIAEFEPRQPVDLSAFGGQRAVYAAADGIWPIYFAIVDREHYATTLLNGCMRVEVPGVGLSEPHYLFSLDRRIHSLRPYRAGTVYLLPGDDFVPEPPLPFEGVRIHTAQCARFTPVRPLAKLAVEPEDFPFLDRMLAHDDERLALFGAAVQQGKPWPE
jgi:hypothetical protein